MKKQNNERPPVNLGSILIRVAAGLFVLTMISIYLLGGLFARYVTKDSGSDSARVAAFGDLTLTETGDFGTMGNEKGMIIPGVPLKKDATVTFSGSEMATVVFVEVITSNDWSTDDDYVLYSNNGLSWSMNDGWKWLDEDTYDGSKRNVYYKVLGPNETLEADIVAEDGKITVSEEITKDSIGSLGNTKLTFRASVIQSGGFKTVAEAWTAMAAK